mgnify:CR=1 FL=1
MAREDLHFRLRIPEALKERIEAAAASNNRSMTAEIISRLERSFEVEDEWENTLSRISDLEGKLDYVFSEVFPGKVWTG